MAFALVRAGTASMGDEGDWREARGIRFVGSGEDE